MWVISAAVIANTPLIQQLVMSMSHLSFKLMHTVVAITVFLCANAPSCAIDLSISKFTVLTKLHYTNNRTPHKIWWPVWHNGRAFTPDPKARRIKSRLVRFQITAHICHQAV